MQRGQYLAVFAVRYGLRPNLAACDKFIDFIVALSGARSDPVNSSLHGGATDASAQTLFFPFSPFFSGVRPDVQAFLLQLALSIRSFVSSGF